MSTTTQDSLIQTPTLIPSICFFITFTLMTLLHFVKYIKFKRAIYLYLLVFSLLRTILFIIRIAWSPNPDLTLLGIISNVLLLGGFFVILEALYKLLTDWLHLLIRERTISSLTKCEQNSIIFLKLISPLFSIIGAIGEALATQNISLTSIFRQASSLGFLCLIVIYILLVAHFALKYGEVAIRKQLKALVLFISAALLLIELVYRTFVSFSQESTPIYYEWVFYVFECVPEAALLLILGEVILGEWFYNVDDDNKLKMAQQLAKLRSKGKFGANMINKIHQKEEKEGESNSQEDSSNIIVIRMDDDGKLSPINSTDNANNTATDITKATTKNTNANTNVNSTDSTV
ncbi:unnamed protein product [Rhizophagus irregularis]|uniref:Transmembrane protein n=1 Tax=Rhizophagus irregularis TaxID=588596 RepID=A0A2N1NQ37_9GLOM|nr:hypothetical protein RhiirC2_862899 [Rhizophagus irregularis]CAB4387290.1 unnamed protein product [Rhizophagus irregularis]CAB5389333.1 unnamed protein product [Rhizophagus irregularis]